MDGSLAASSPSWSVVAQGTQHRDAASAPVLVATLLLRSSCHSCFLAEETEVTKFLKLPLRLVPDQAIINTHVNLSAEPVSLLCCSHVTLAWFLGDMSTESQRNTVS